MEGIVLQLLGIGLGGSKRQLGVLQSLTDLLDAALQVWTTIQNALAFNNVSNNSNMELKGVVVHIVMESLLCTSERHQMNQSLSLAKRVQAADVKQ